MKSAIKPAPPKTVDEYISRLPKTTGATLNSVRKSIKKIAPDTAEIISYQIPTVTLNGKPFLAYAAFNAHCGLYTMSKAIIKTLADDLSAYYTAGVTIRFPLDKPLPASLLKKIIKARMLEYQARDEAKAGKINDKETAEVAAFMKKLDHPLKAEIEEVRKIIKGAGKNISERVKWNAPSYYYKEDMVTFNPRMQDKVHLIFHHPAIEKIKSPLLEGDYKGRRMTYFSGIKDIKAKKKELVRVINELMKYIDK